MGGSCLEKEAGLTELIAVMADSSVTRPQFQTRVAKTRQHLRRGQAAAKKSRVTLSDSVKDAQVGEIYSQLVEYPSLLLQQHKLKEEKEAKRATFDARHQHLFSTVATKLQMQDSEVEDFIIEGDQAGLSSHTRRK